MKLYHFPPSPNSRKVRAVALHLGLEIEEQVVNLLEGEQNDPEFVRLNPNHKVPTLVDGDFVLWESNAIMQYLAAQAPDSPLWPEEPAQQASVSRWQCWQLAHWDPACSTIIGERVVKQLAGGGEPDQAVIDRAEVDFHRFAKVLDAHLENREFLTGPEPTLGDLSVAAPLMYAEQAALPIEGYRNIRRWYAGIEALDAWQRSAG